jgi:hypothetical protein
MFVDGPKDTYVQVSPLEVLRVLVLEGVVAASLALARTTLGSPYLLPDPSTEDARLFFRALGICGFLALLYGWIQNGAKVHPKTSSDDQT